MLSLFDRSWRALALRGVCALLFGVAAFAWPGITVRVLVLLYGAYALIDGIFALIVAFAGWERDTPWGAALLLEGIVGITIGAITFIWPGITALVLLYLIAAWAILTGVLEVAAAVRLRSAIPGEWLLTVSGGLSIVFGLVLVIAPGAGALAVIWLIGTFAIVFGTLFLVLAFRMRGWCRELRAIAS